jgi:hypothetical protein
MGDTFIKIGLATRSPQGLKELFPTPPCAGVTDRLRSVEDSAKLLDSCAPLGQAIVMLKKRPPSGFAPVLITFLLILLLLGLAIFLSPTFQKCIEQGASDSGHGKQSNKPVVEAFGCAISLIDSNHNLIVAMRWLANLLKPLSNPLLSLNAPLPISNGRTSFSSAYSTAGRSSNRMALAATCVLHSLIVGVASLSSRLFGTICAPFQTAKCRPPPIPLLTPGTGFRLAS